MAFLLKKVLGAALMPLSLVFILAAAALLVRWRTERIGLARRLAAGAAVTLLLCSLPVVVGPVARSMEATYPPFPGDSVAAVIVLGGGHRMDPELPRSAWLAPEALARLTEGVHIARAQPWATLMLSGYGGDQEHTSAEAYAQAAVALGVDEARIVVDGAPRDTGEEAQAWAPRVQGEPFALVTSALHMPRAVSLFRGQGVEPVPAPTAHHVGPSGPLTWRDFVPSPEALVTTHRLAHEVLGRVWVRLRGTGG